MHFEVDNRKQNNDHDDGIYSPRLCIYFGQKRKGNEGHNHGWERIKVL